MVVGVAGESAYQDVRVLRLDAVAAAVLDAADTPITRSALADAVRAATGEPVATIDELIDGLTAARILEQTSP
jgi:hypothetical protein